jgi:hypothetical protein
MCAELRRGDLPRPHHDIYSLGVLWYQLLVGDVTREVHPGWAEELLSEFQTPKKHVEVLQRCLGYYKRRPTSAGDLLPILQSLSQIEGTRPVVTFVSERLRKLDERFARASGMVSPPISAGEGLWTGARSESVDPVAESFPIETEIIPQTDESQETVWCQETRILGAGFIPRPGATPVQINRDAELSRLKRLLSDQMANQAYEAARETVEVLRQLYPQDAEVQQAHTFLAQNQ